MKILEKFGDNQDKQHLMNNFHQAGKIKKHACKILRGFTKNKKEFEIFLKNIAFFD